jgi:hypothetical protein
MPPHTGPTVVGTRVWDGSRDPGLSTWLGPHSHHYEGEQLVIDSIDGPVRPRPGYRLALWTDGEVTVASPRTAERVYGPDGLCGQLALTQAAVGRVRRLSEMTIQASCRVQAIDQARDTLAELDRTDTGEAPAAKPPHPMPFAALLHGQLLAVLDDHIDCPCCTTSAIADTLLAAVLPYTDSQLRQQLHAALKSLGTSETAVQRITALQERWVKAGAPPLGTSMSRWWDARLIELNAALGKPTEGTTTP